MKFLSGIGINVILLGIVSFMTDISSEMMLAILPMFIISLGGGGIAIGLISGLGDGVSSILNVFSGYWSDKSGKRKTFALSGYLISACVRLLFPFAQDWRHLLILRPIERIGKGIRSAPRDALIAQSCTKETRGKAFGIHRMADTSGAIIGALLAFILYFKLNLDFKSILLISAILGFLAMIPFLWIKEKINQSLNDAKGLVCKISLKDIPVGFKKYLLVVVLFSLANFTYMFFILRALDKFKEFLPTQLAQSLPIILYLWFNIVYAFVALPAGMLSDKIGRKNVLSIGYIIYTLTCIGFFWAHSVIGFIIFFATYGVCFALIEGNQRAYASDFATKDTSGTLLGLLHTAISISTIVAGIIAGLLWDYNPNAPFIYGAVLSLLAGIIIGLIKPKLLKEKSHD